MAIDPAIKQRINKLGGTTPSGDVSLKDFLLGTSFPHYLYDRDWDVYGVDKFFEENRAVYEKDVDQFLDLIEQHYFSKHDCAYGQRFWRPALFTPLTAGTADCKEWESWFAEDADLSPLREFCGDGPLEFVQIIHEYGYPDHYYVCLQDPVPENPTVLGTDHEEFFQEVSADEPLLEFLNTFCTREDFREIVREYLEANP